MRRSKMSHHRSRKVFRRGASQVHGLNHLSSSSSRYTMRGGIRL